MDTSTSPEIKITPQNTGFAREAAKASWASSVIVFLILALGSRTGAKAILELVSLVLILLGLSLGFIALFGIRKHGMKGILAPAITGIIINGLLVFIFATNFFAARARAQRDASAMAKFTSVPPAG